MPIPSNSKRFFVDANFGDKEIFLTDENLLNQFVSVLRLKKGENIFLFNKDKKEVETEILEITKKQAHLKITKVLKKTRTKNNTKRVALYCSILKKENFELVVQKATEVGVSEIIPVISERTIKLGLKQERLLKIVQEAAEQSGRTDLPVLGEPIKFSKAIAEIQNRNSGRVGPNCDPNQDLNLFFDITGENFINLDMRYPSDGKINIFIGPEGGWSPAELAAAKAARFTIASLSSHLTLRAETAAIVASYLATHCKIK